MKRHVLGVTLLAAIVCVPATAWAQGSEEAPWGPGTTLAVFAGGASADSRVSGAAGATLGWELTPYLAIEGSGIWFGDKVGAPGFAALLGPRVSLLPPQTVVPAVFAGVGMFRASVNVNDARLPEFYARRLGSTLATEQIFQDFVFAAGGGADVFLGHHLAIRPDVRVLFARAESDTRVVPVFGVHLTYHFEPHPYLPRR